MATKFIKAIFSTLFILMITIPLVTTNLKDNTLSEAENRTLTAKAKLYNEDGTFNKNFNVDFEDWFNDNVGQRSNMVYSNSLIQLLVFKNSPSEKVIVGKDGWYFYNNESAVADYQGTNLYTEEVLEQIKANLEITRDELAEKGIEFVIFIAPNKHEIYADKMPSEYGELTDYTRAQQLYDYLKNDFRIVYPREALDEARKNYPEYVFYCHLDTHWNNLGAYVGAKELVKELGYELPEIDQLSLEKTTSSGLDLSNMMNLKKILKIDENYNVSGYSDRKVERLENDYNTVFRYSTSGADDRKVMVVRDSFSTALAPYLASQFNDCVLFHRSYYTTDMLDIEQPDIVIYETVERNINNMKTDKIVE